MNLTAADLDRLETCDHRIASIVRRVSMIYPCQVLEGHRGEARQNAAFAEGKSKLRWPDGKHNALPSLAVDVAPLPINWADREAFSYFAGHMMMAAESMGYKLRWGGDWDGDYDLHDNKLVDLVHFELVLPATADVPKVAVA